MQTEKAKTTTVFPLFMAAIALALTLAGCGGGGGGGNSGTGGGVGGGGNGATLTMITVTPANSNVTVGGTQQFTATGFYSDATTANITSSVTWSSSATNVATVNQSGLASGVASGTATITATSGLISGSTTLSATAWTTRLQAPRSTLALGGIAWNGTTYVTTQDAISTSNNLTNWSEQVSMASANDVVWNGSRFVAAGFFGIRSSTDGMTWTSGYSPSNEPYRIAYSSALPLWVAVGAGGSIYTSPDGMTWSTRVSNLSTFTSLYSVTWAGTQFVAVGSGGTIITSPDGVTWTTRTSGTTGSFSAVGANSTLLVACGQAGIYTSTDGIAWTSSASSLPNICSSIIYAGGQWVAVGFNFAATSPDGTTWTTASSTVGQLNSVIWDGTQYVAAGGTTFGNPAIYTSPNGNSWALRTTYQSNKAIARSPAGLLVAVSSTDRSLASTDNGVTWQYGGFHAGSTSDFFKSVVWYPALSEFVAAGGTGVYTSTDGLTWALAGTYCSGNISASPTLLVNACVTGGISTSPDGVTWTSRTTPSTQRATGVFWTGTQFVALGAGGDIVTSPDGATWALQTSGTTNSLNGFAASPTQMVAVGYGGTIITSSDNGVTWTLRASGTSATLNHVVWTGAQFVAIGGGGIILNSTDGISWATQTTPYTNTLFGSDPYNLNDIVSTGSSVVVVGDRGLVATSP